jgi:quinol monooxygenase YgiN
MAEGVAKSDMPEAGVILGTVVKAKPGQEDAVKALLVALVEPTRKEPGCLCYNLHQSKSDKTHFMFYQQWASKEAFAAHRTTPHMKVLGERLKNRTEPLKVVFYELLK